MQGADHEEIQLWKNRKEREEWEELADMFAILKSTEKLERAYVRDAISSKVYEQECQKLIGQYRTLYDSVRDRVPDLGVFANTYNMQCPMALKRLHAGLPANIEHASTGSSSEKGKVLVAETVQTLITAMDSLRLNMTAVDQVFPLLKDALASLNKHAELSPDWNGKKKLRDWVAKLNNMPAHQDLGEAEVRQLQFDLESSYADFLAALQ